MSFESPTLKFDRRKAEVLRAFDASAWLKGAVAQLCAKDVEDAVKDAELLLDLMKLRSDEVFSHASRIAAAGLKSEKSARHWWFDAVAPRRPVAPLFLAGPPAPLRPKPTMTANSTANTANAANSQGLLMFESEDEAARRAAIDDLHARTALYTASPVVDDLLVRLGWPSGTARLVDPSCGDGMFLARALSALLAARPAGFDPRGQIEGWEIHPIACIEARSRVAGILVSHGWSHARAATLATHMVHNRDFLTEGPTTPQWDIVAGNPPYLRAANVPDLLRTEYSRHVPDYAQGDLLHSFLERCSRTVLPAGRIGLVTSDRWLFNQGASRLRENLGQRLSLGPRRLVLTTTHQD
ncbi:MULTISPECIES: Eco57I restriction-modification methylase domain-containing protein [unclassified Cupriavidus]|uniref:Eco57I restriction-modification methylase domain-containing protein n=1 Tax=unclassified Cupriavidus TaxID=2640874 RepID=UPI001FD7AA24|nr:MULTISPECIES: N-6 DNA methylase [unclassified Cupriavidus]